MRSGGFTIATGRLRFGSGKHPLSNAGCFPKLPAGIRMLDPKTDRPDGCKSTIFGYVHFACDERATVVVCLRVYCLYGKRVPD